MILSLTGHRPNKLNNEWNHDGILSKKIETIIRHTLKELDPEFIIIGMSLGVDTIGANAAVREGYPFKAYVPFDGQEKLWQRKNKEYYYKLLDFAYEVKYISEPPYAPWKMTKRNEAMVNDSLVLLAIWNGDKFGGTYNTLQYAERVGKDIIKINPNNL